MAPRRAPSFHTIMDYVLFVLFVVAVSVKW